MFEQPNQPIHLDIGSAGGKFLINMAEEDKTWNFVGVEIRNPLVRGANLEIEKRDLNNVKFLFCNANISLDSWLSRLPSSLLKRVTIQFPDPWFKTRHFKRRIMQPTLLRSISSSLSPGSELFIQSDVLEVIHPMIRLIDNSHCFFRDEDQTNFSLNTNPFLISTEREKYALSKGLDIYRVLYKRNDNPYPT